MKPPDGPGLNPDLDGIDRQWVPSQPAVGDSIPIAVVFVGHFDDRRAELCPPAEQAECRDRFVVDQVAWVDRVDQPPSQVDEVGLARSSVEDILTVVAREGRDRPVLSIVATDGPSGLGTIEPSLKTRRQGLIEQPVVWIVRVLGGSHVETYIVDDVTHAIFQMTAEGDAVAIGYSPGPGSSPAAWPPAGSSIVELAGPSGFPAHAAVVDESGRLEDIGVDRQTDQSLVADPIGLYADPKRPERVSLVWRSGLCADDFVVTIAGDLRSIAVIGDAGPACRAGLVTRGLVLDFSGPVDFDIVKVTLGITPTGD